MIICIERKDGLYRVTAYEDDFESVSFSGDRESRLLANAGISVEGGRVEITGGLRKTEYMSDEFEPSEWPDFLAKHEKTNDGNWWKEKRGIFVKRKCYIAKGWWVHRHQIPYSMSLPLDRTIIEKMGM